MLKTHSFEVASLVNFRPAGQSEQAFTVVRHLPTEGRGPLYRLRADSGQERVAEEALLSRSSAKVETASALALRQLFR